MFADDPEFVHFTNKSSPVKVENEDHDVSDIELKIQKTLNQKKKRNIYSDNTSLNASENEEDKNDLR